MTGGRGLLTRAKTYYQGRRKKYRPVFQISSTNLHVTLGQVGATMAGVVTAFIVHAPGPWGLAAVTAGGLAAGSYFFPVPDGYGKFTLHSEDELQAMTRGEVRAHLYKLRDQEMHIGIPAAILRRQASAAKEVTARHPAPAGAAEMSLVNLRAWRGARLRHEEAVRRWSQYELDPAMQIRFPAMTDIREAPTAAMIRAMRQAKEASEGDDAQGYARAVEQLAQAIEVAEVHAKAHQVPPDHHGND